MSNKDAFEKYMEKRGFTKDFVDYAMHITNAENENLGCIGIIDPLPKSIKPHYFAEKVVINDVIPIENNMKSLFKSQNVYRDQEWSFNLNEPIGNMNQINFSGKLISKYKQGNLQCFTVKDFDQKVSDIKQSLRTRGWKMRSGFHPIFDRTKNNKSKL